MGIPLKKRKLEKQVITHKIMRLTERDWKWVLLRENKVIEKQTFGEKIDVRIKIKVNAEEQGL